MDRAALEKLSRDELILRAEQVGVERARILTRPELIDEILLSTLARSNKRELKKARGFFGMARDLINRVVEKGLHLPDAAERLRSLVPPPPTIARPTAGALPTVTLAEIYASQGHTERAVDTLERVIAGEPEHAAAHALLAKLRARDYVAPPRPELPPEQDPSLVPAAIPKGETDVAEINDAVQSSLASVLAIAKAAASEIPPPCEALETVDAIVDSATDEKSADAIAVDTRVDSIEAIPVGNGRLSVHYSVSVDALSRALVTSRELTIRVLRYFADPAGTSRVQTDLPVKDREGFLILADLPEHGCTRIALGSLDTHGKFHPIAHAQLLEGTLPAVSRWQPAGSTPVTIDKANIANVTKPAIALDRRASKHPQPSLSL